MINRLKNSIHLWLSYNSSRYRTWYLDKQEILRAKRESAYMEMMADLCDDIEVPVHHNYPTINITSDSVNQLLLSGAGKTLETGRDPWTICTLAAPISIT